MSTSAEVLILITGDPVPEAERRRGNFAQMIRDIIPNASTYRFRDIDVRNGSVASLEASGPVVVTGSPSSVTERQPWMEETSAKLRDWVQAGVPVLGICFGHQLLAHALGGEVRPNPNGREIGTVEVEVGSPDDPVAGPSSRYLANATHVDSVVALPPGAVALARTALEPHAAIRFAKAAWGVQFHPEIDAQIMADYVSARAEILRAEALDPDALLRRLSDAPSAAATVYRFLRWVEGAPR